MIQTLLIANRGEIATRIARTCRRLGIRSVAVFSDADADALHVDACDVAVRLPGVASADTYLRIDLLLEAAARAGVDAVHPGYGFLAENDAFARAVIDAGLTWVGPSPEAIAAMGSKIEAKARMRAVGVPVLPDSTVVALDQVGFPMLLKASAGGGGRGMRIVRTTDEFETVREAAEREAAAAFGDGTVFCERYVEHGRHVEVQVFGDTHGNTVALFERECSIQRRHQKIVEEAPSPAVDAELRERLCAAAVTAARDVGYVGAGTVEFLLDPQGEFWFLEMNTRLQVEHPVTEAVTGLDLVELQLLVADGHVLPAEALEPTLHGHAIEVRLTAEDPAAGYLPATGPIHRFDVPGADGDPNVPVPGRHGLRVDSGVRSGSVVSPFYDSMVAKVIAHGATRDIAMRRLRGALRTARVHGPTTNLSQLRQVLAHPEVVSGQFSTSFLDEHPCTDIDTPRPVTYVAAVLALQARARADARVLAGVPSGWRNNPATDRSRSFEHVGPTGTVVDVRYRLGRSPWFGVDTGDGLRTVDLEIVEATADRVVVVHDGVRSAHQIEAIAEDRLDTTGATIHVHGPDGGTTLRLLPRFPLPESRVAAGSLVAPMPGAIRWIHVAVGDPVTAGQALVALEAMKMEHQIVAPSDGIVAEILVAADEQVDTGQTLLRIDPPHDPDSTPQGGQPGDTAR